MREWFLLPVLPALGSLIRYLILAGTAVPVGGALLLGVSAPVGEALLLGELGTGVRTLEAVAPALIPLYVLCLLCK